MSKRISETFFSFNYNFFVYSCRLIDGWQHSYDKDKTYRIDWKASEPRSIATGCTAVYFVFAFLRSFSLTSYFRTLESLRISMIKMFIDVTKFLFIFSLVLFAFAVGLTELFWYYGTKQGKNLLCNSNRTDVKKLEDICHEIPFSNLRRSLEFLFWSLFGYYTPILLQFDVKSPGLNLLGNILVGAFHVTVLIVLLNMIIAMMTKSFDQVSENKESVCTFNITASMLTYIKGEFTIVRSIFSIFFFWCNLNCNYFQNDDTLTEPSEVIKECVKRYRDT